MSGRIESTIIIAHEGAASSGKSRQTARNKRRFAGDPRIHVQKDDARRFFKANPGVLDKSIYTFDVQIPILRHKITHLEKLINDPTREIGVFDGSVVANKILLDYFGNPEEAAQLSREIEPFLPLYTLFFLHDPEGVPFEDDGVRQEKPDDRPKIHQAYLEFFTKYNLPFTVITGSLKERTKQINAAIDALRTREHTVFEAESAPVT